MKKIKCFIVLSIVAVLVDTCNGVTLAGDTSGFFKGYSYMQKGEY